MPCRRSPRPILTAFAAANENIEKNGPKNTSGDSLKEPPLLSLILDFLFPRSLLLEDPVAQSGAEAIGPDVEGGSAAE